jgi:hypothetical protein
MASPPTGPPTSDLPVQVSALTRGPSNAAYAPYRSPSTTGNGLQTTLPHHERRPSNTNNELARSQGTEVLDRKSTERPRTASGKEKTHIHGDHRRPSNSTRTCGKCGGSLTGQFVRALENTYHLECFTCNVCLSSIIGWPDANLE